MQGIFSYLKLIQHRTLHYNSALAEGSKTWKDFTAESLEVHEWVFPHGKHKDSLLVFQQSGRAGHWLGLDMEIEVCGSDIIFSSKFTLHQRKLNTQCFKDHVDQGWDM